MKIKFSGLWRTTGTVDRGSYPLVGVVRLAVKHNFDRLAPISDFHRQ